MNVYLKIVKTPEGEDYYYSFTLWGDIESVDGNRQIKESQYKKFRDSIVHIREFIDSYLAKLSGDIQQANDLYIANMTRWVRVVSRMIIREFLPDTESKFAKKFSELETLARGGSDINITILTNEFLVPWWLSRPYCDGKSGDLWGNIFSIGLIPAFIGDTVEDVVIKEPRIALISRPTQDLSKAKNIEERLDETGVFSPVERKAFNIQNGKKNQHEEDMGFFGLVRKDIVDTLTSGEIIFYYGHFELDETFPGNSTLQATYGYDVTGEVTRDPIKLDDVKDLLEGKILFLNACRSIGLPFLEDNPFPSQEKILPNYFLKNQTVCIGTIYPIYANAAVDYMTYIMKFLLQGDCLGKAVRDARRMLMDSDDYTFFDWAPYILVGNPLICVDTKKE